MILNNSHGFGYNGITIFDNGQYSEQPLVHTSLEQFDLEMNVKFININGKCIYLYEHALSTSSKC